MRTASVQIFFASIFLFFLGFTDHNYLEDPTVAAAPTLTPVINPLSNDFEVLFDQSVAVIPCPCFKRGSVPMPYGKEPRLIVSVTTNTAIRGPLNYWYEVSVGKIISDGPVVIWDLSRVPPGEYEITVHITDAMDPVGKTISKTAPLVPMNCTCPCSCPEIRVESNLSSVRQGDIVKFGADVAGGNFSENQVGYQWKVSNGVIKSGQGTYQISVKAGSKASLVAAEVSILGTDPACNCPIKESASADVGKKSIPQHNESDLLSFFLDEARLIIPVREDYAICGEPTSKDMIVGVSLNTHVFPENSSYEYAVTAGKIIGSGKKVQWNLDGVAPGAYAITISEFRNGKLVGEKKTASVTVSAPLICDYSSCPAISISGTDRPVRTGETFAASASVAGGSQDSPLIYNWMVSSGEITSGQSTPAIMIKAPSGSSSHSVTVTLNIGGIDPASGCPTRVNEQFPIKP